MKRYALVAAALAMSGCGENSGNTPADATSAKPAGLTGQFEARFGDRSIAVAVSCSDLNKDYFRFGSDKSDITDSNNDGVIVSGMQTDSDLTLTIVQDAQTWSARRVNLEKGGDGASGQGQIWLDGGAATPIDIKYSVLCR